MTPIHRDEAQYLPHIPWRRAGFTFATIASVAIVGLLSSGLIWATILNASKGLG